MTSMTRPDVEPASHGAQGGAGNGEPILEVHDLKKYFPIKSSGIIRRSIGSVQAVDGVSFQVQKGSALGLVGESGCGKSTTGRLITRLYDPTSGSMKFDGREIRSEERRVGKEGRSARGPGH